MSNHELSRGNVRRMVDDDLPGVLAWRNDPEIRRHMYTRHEISLEEHRSWFERATSDPSRHLLIFELDATPLGFVNFHAPGSGKIAEWGFYLSPMAPRGIGLMLGTAALDHGFGTLSFHKVCGEALASNEKSIRLHLKLGFKEEGVLRDQHFDGGSFHTVVRFGLLEAEWPNPTGNRDRDVLPS
jgi:UDP-4-amino-4,6-dideoxy-N-acetyl-beta-L-altrosamine N-acetyltransferase